MRAAFVLCFAALACSQHSSLPIVINTWSGSFSAASSRAFSVLSSSNDAVSAVVEGCRICQSLQCDGTVGFGGSPDESGDTTLDALVIDGDTMRMGAVGYLRRVKDAIGVAHAIMTRTQLTFLSGDGATEFARQMGFEVLPNLETNASHAMFEKWRSNKCQPNYWIPGSVTPDPSSSCGPYSSVNNDDDDDKKKSQKPPVHVQNHDTISMVAISSTGSMAAATSTNGLSHKIVGRIGDGPMPGSGSFADSEVGGCGETGDGDVMLRFSPCALVVEWMRGGKAPSEAAQMAVDRIARFFPSFVGGIVAINKKGDFGAAARGWNMTYSVYNASGLFVFSI